MMFIKYLLIETIEGANTHSLIDFDIFGQCFVYYFILFLAGKAVNN